MNITIEEFIKHLESKGYILLNNSYNLACKLNLPNTIRTIWFKENHLNIYDEKSATDLDFFYDGKIESLEQFDLIDRLTS